MNNDEVSPVPSLMGGVFFTACTLSFSFSLGETDLAGRAREIICDVFLFLYVRQIWPGGQGKLYKFFLILW